MAWTRLNVAPRDVQIDWEWEGWDGARSPRSAKRVLCRRLMEMQRYTAGRLGEARFAQLRRDAAVHLREDSIPPGQALGLGFQGMPAPAPPHSLPPAHVHARGKSGRGGAPPDKRMWWCTTPAEPPDPPRPTPPRARQSSEQDEAARRFFGELRDVPSPTLDGHDEGDALGSPTSSASAGAITGSPLDDFDLAAAAKVADEGPMVSLGGLVVGPFGDLLEDDALAYSPSSCGLPLDDPDADFGLLNRCSGSGFWRESQLGPDPRLRLYGGGPASSVGGTLLFPAWGDADEGEADKEADEEDTLDSEGGEGRATRGTRGPPAAAGEPCLLPAADPDPLGFLPPHPPSTSSGTRPDGGDAHDQIKFNE